MYLVDGFNPFSHLAETQCGYVVPPVAEFGPEGRQNAGGIDLHEHHCANSLCTEYRTLLGNVLFDGGKYAERSSSSTVLIADKSSISA